MGFRGLKRSKQEVHGVSMKFRVRDPRPTVTVQDSHRVMKKFMRRFDGEPDRFNEIVATLDDFSISTAAVVERMKVLLEGHPDLLHEFNQFVPWQYIRDHGPVVGICI